jgi:hypothetical protein
MNASEHARERERERRRGWNNTRLETRKKKEPAEGISGENLHQPTRQGARDASVWLGINASKQEQNRTENAYRKAYRRERE